MTALEELKQELINQKNAIEEKGGTVIVANTYPSPAEITAGIKTIPTSTQTTSLSSVTSASNLETQNNDISMVTENLSASEVSQTSENVNASELAEENSEINENLNVDSGEMVEIEPNTTETQSTVFSSNIVNN